MNSDQPQYLPAKSSAANLSQHQQEMSLIKDIYPEELIEKNHSLDLKEFINVISRRKKMILATTIITLILALLLTLLMKPVYRADSTIKVERYAANANVEILNAESSRSDRDFFETQIQLIQTKTLANRVINLLGLDKKETTSGLLATIKSLFSFNSNEPPPKNDSEIAEIFLDNLMVTPISNSQLLKISYDSSSPELAADISNAVAQTFVRQNLERRFDNATWFKSYVADNIEVIRKSLEDAEKRLNEYARKNNIVQDVDGESTDSYTLKKQSEELVSAEKERIEAEAAYQLIKSNPDADPSSVINDPYILSLKKAAARLETQYQGIKNKRTRTARRLRTQIDDLLKQIETENAAIKGSIEIRYLQAQQKERMLRAQVEKQKLGAIDIQSKNAKYTRLLREVELNQIAYDKQLEQLMAVNLASNVGSNNIAIIDKASVPTKKYKPSIKTNLGLGLLLGLLLGTGIAFLREFVDDSIKDSKFLEKMTGLPVLSQLPNMRNAGDKKLALLTALEPRSSLAEAIRTLRTSLRFSSRNGSPLSTFITSSAAGEGKTTLALNLATAYAQANHKVLLIDADLRNPSLHRLLELKNSHGLTNILSKPDSLQEQELGRISMIKNLEVITSGPIPPDPVELLSGEKLAELLEKASEQYDHIIIDGPPVLGIADALLIANLADATLIAVEAGKTRKTQLLDSLKRLERANATLSGTVLTRISKAINPEYDQQYYSYSVQNNKSGKLVRIKS